MKKEGRWSWSAPRSYDERREKDAEEDRGNSGTRGISESRRTKEKEKTIRRTAEPADEEMRRRGRGEEEEANREGPRGDRHWRRSNNGLLTMIIEHEAAGTLLKSTENRAGGFTCRINFYLVPSLPRSLAFSSSSSTSFSFVSLSPR